MPESTEGIDAGQVTAMNSDNNIFGTDNKTGTVHSLTNTSKN